MSFNEYILGKRHRLSWVDETSFGVGGDMATNGEVIGLNATIEPDFNQNWQEILSDGSSGRTIDGQELGALDLPFNLTFTPVSAKFFRYCGYDFDNVETPAESGKFVHTGTLQNAIRSFKLEWAMQHSSPVVITLKGCTVLDAVINFSAGAGEGESMISVTLSCHAKSFSKGSSVTSLDSGNITRTPFHFRHFKLTNNDVEIAEVNNGEITIDQGIDPSDSRYCNATLDREVGEFIPKVHRISGRYNINIKDDTQIAQWSAGVSIPDCKLEFIKGADDYVKMQLDGFKTGQGFPATALDGVTNMDVVWKCNKFNPLELKDNLGDY